MIVNVFVAAVQRGVGIRLIATNSLVSRLSVKRFRRSNSIFFSVMFRCESVKKLCTCVIHLQQFQMKANMFFFRSILFLMTMVSSCPSLIFDGDGLSTEGSCMFKTTNVP